MLSTVQKVGIGVYKRGKVTHVRRFGVLFKGIDLHDSLYTTLYGYWTLYLLPSSYSIPGRFYHNRKLYPG